MPRLRSGLLMITRYLITEIVAIMNVMGCYGPILKRWRTTRIGEFGGVVWSLEYWGCHGGKVKETIHYLGGPPIGR